LRRSGIRYSLGHDIFGREAFGGFNRDASLIHERVVVTNDVRRDIIQLLPRLRRFSYALAGDPVKGDDLLQEACARAFASLHQFELGTRLDSWMYRIIRNIWLNHKRASRVRGTVIDIDEAPEQQGEDGRDVAESRMTLVRVLDAMVKLPREQQELIALVCIEGVSYQEAARILDIPVGTVTSRLARGRRTLYAIAVEGQRTLEGEYDKVD
jgi:RNA polymerase sigma-70 factor (ECF subfamily)